MIRDMSVWFIPKAGGDTGAFDLDVVPTAGLLVLYVLPVFDRLERLINVQYY